MVAIILAAASISFLIANEPEPQIIFGFLVLFAIAVFVFLTAKNVHIVIDKSHNLIHRSEKSV